MTELVNRHCVPCEGGVSPLNAAAIAARLADLSGWALDKNGTSQSACISKTYHFKNYYETMAFVNATAWVSHREDHHPDLAVGYKECTVRYTTHAIGGLSENDFICAAKIDALYAR
ncbi:MAG: 4a-hydroxytetrahydrobiopterin dehydratase [Rhodocyclales bacterium]|nr:4a-hydroxytetrahydrobiopterin dehydratase [Rhodocyclales bacterium]